jgi:Flp pilus assembly protein TadB
MAAEQEYFSTGVSGFERMFRCSTEGMIERFRSPVMQGMKTMAISSMDALGHDVERHRMWLVALGASLILLGIVAVASSLATTYASMLVLAGILLVGAVIRWSRPSPRGIGPALCCSSCPGCSTLLPQY